MPKCVSAAEAVACVRSGHRVFLHGGVATPLALVKALVDRAPELRDVEITHLHTAGTADYARPEFAASFRVANLFTGANIRPYIDHDRVDYVPCFLSEIPSLFRTKTRHLSVAMVQLSPPDRHGFCTLGTSVDVARAAVDSADIVVAQINPRMPRVHGDGFVHLGSVDYFIEEEAEIPEHRPEPLTEVERAIGRNCAELIEDGATLQMGIGAVPDAVLAALAHHKHLGIHTEMFSDGVLPLYESGAIDNTQKVIHPGKLVAGFTGGSRKLYDFIDDNPAVVFLDIAYVNQPNVIARNPKMAAINSAVEVDLTGQVCADSIGHRIISGVGGQMDFMRGAFLSKGGKPIIALPSTTKRGESRITTTLKPGAGVVTTRPHVHFVVTEYGVAYLFGKTLRERAKAMIAIAAPQHREQLDREWHELCRASRGS
ncbi:MAG: acetyl-CoA hydrolase/transferase family protein [Acidobacteria bacterium]|nr:acetyl-CoA hydrolase/transferase family protein [Acidobacteriota bacterium]